MKKPLKILIGLILLPSAIFVLYDFGGVVLNLIKNFKLTFFFLFGIIIYTLLHIFVYNFSRVYVLAHEFTHALAAWVCGYKVSSISVKEDSGATKVNGINSFVLLAPYCFPLYLVLLTVIFYITNFFYPTISNYRNIFLILAGFFTALHFIHTYKSLTEADQSDVTQAGGTIFSFPLIILINIVLIILLLELLFPRVITSSTLIANVFMQTVSFWKSFFIYLYKFIVWLGSR